MEVLVGVLDEVCRGGGGGGAYRWDNTPQGVRSQLQLSLSLDRGPELVPTSSIIIMSIKGPHKATVHSAAGKEKSRPSTTTDRGQPTLRHEVTQACVGGYYHHISYHIYIYIYIYIYNICS